MPRPEDTPTPTDAPEVAEEKSPADRLKDAKAEHAKAPKEHTLAEDERAAIQASVREAYRAAKEATHPFDRIAELRGAVEAEELAKLKEADGDLEEAARLYELALLKRKQAAEAPDPAPAPAEEPDGS